MMRLVLPASLAAALCLFASTAAATSECSSTQIDSIQPADGQVDVPVDAVFRVLLKRSDTCADDFSDARIRLQGGDLDVDGTTIIESDIAELAPDAPLLENTEYMVTIDGMDNVDGGVATATFTFTTGAHTTEELLGEPILEILELVHDPGFDEEGDGDTVHAARLRLTPAAADPHNLSLLRLIDSTGPNGSGRFHAPVGSADPVEVVVFTPAGFEEELCYEAQHVTGNGNILRSERICAESAENADRFDDLGGSVLTSNGGCSASNTEAGSVPALTLIGLAAAASLVRRRRRS